MITVWLILTGMAGFAAGFVLSAAFGLQRQDELMQALVRLLEDPTSPKVRQYVREILKG